MNVFLYPKRLAAVIFGLGLFVALQAGIWQAKHNKTMAEERFDRLTGRVASEVTAQMKKFEYGLRGARGAVVAAGADLADRRSFHNYSATRDIDREFPGARGYGVIRRVTPENEKAFVAASRLDGWPDFAIRQFQPHEGERDVIQYFEPVERNGAAIGVDIASEVNRRVAAQESLRTGSATLTAPIALVQDSGKPPQSFLLLLPIYRPGAAHSTPGERDAAAIGWAYTALTIGGVLKGIEDSDDQYTLVLRDKTRGASTDFFAEHDVNATAASGLQRRIAIPIFGRDWEAEIRGTQTFVHLLAQPDPIRMGLSVAGVSALVATLVFLLAQGMARARRVNLEQARRAAIVDGSADAIIGETLDGVVTDWNSGAEQLFGYPASFAIGRTATSLVLPVGRESEDVDIRATMARGERMSSFDTVRRHRDGTPIDVSVTAAPILSGTGTCVGFAKTLHDIRPRLRAQRALAELNAGLERQVAERTASLDAAMHDLRSILDAVPSLIGYWDNRLINRVSNRAYTERFGIKADSLRGLHVRDVLGDVVFELSRTHIDRVLQGEPQKFERIVPRPDGLGSFHDLVQYLPDIVDGEVRGFYVLVHDVTEVVEVQLKLADAQRDSEALLRTIREHSIVSVADRAGRIVEVNDSFCRISGYSRDELIGRNHRFINSGEHSQEFWTEMWRTVSTGRSWRGVVCNRAKDGSVYWVDSIVAPFVGSDGKIEKYVSIRSDITARKVAEANLARERHLMDALLDSLPDQIYFKDMEHRFLRINAGLAGRFGIIDPAMAIGKSDADFFTAEHATCTASVEDAIMSTGNPLLDLEEQEFWPDRPPTWNLTTKMALRDSSGGVMGTFGISRDISSRKRMEEQLKIVNDRFSMATASAGIGVWEFDIDSGQLVWDDRMYRLYGRSRSGDVEPLEIWSGSLHPDDRAIAEEALRNAIEGTHEFEPTFRILRPDGEIRYLKAAAQVSRNQDGKALRMAGVNIDVTERVLAEAALAANESLLRRVGGMADVGGWRMELKSGALHWTEQTRAIHDVDRDYVPTLEGGLSFYPPGVRDTIASAVDRAIAAGEGWDLELPLVTRTGRSIWVRAIGEVESENGEPVRLVGALQDITVRRAAEDQLRDATFRAEEANRAKSQFLANMSHEIRTPMNAVIGLSYILARSPLNADQAETLGKIKLASKSLLAIINDVLDLSKIEASEMRIERAPFSLRDLLAEVTTLQTLPAQAKGIALVLEAAADLPAAVEGDSTRLRQVLTNLVSNAIKFTEHGGVRLAVHRLDSSPGMARLRFVVQDSGIGISPEAIGTLFAPFVQADTSTTRRFGGTGLGLSIVKQLVRLMGGDVGVSSRPLEGSEFWAELEFAVCDTVPAAPVAEVALQVDGPGLRGVRILVVDDSTINLEVAKRILEFEGAAVSLASNGQEAVDHLARAPNSVDVVLMDVQMPVLDGHDATARIRNVLGLKGLPIIALTAGVSVDEHQRARASGMNDVIGKPFEPRALVACIRRHVAVADRPDDHALPVVAPSPSLEDWPSIEGIDTHDVFVRLGGDVPLFRRMLKYFLGDFAGVGGDGGGETNLASLAARVHNLTGSAGTLGARSLHRLGALAETACRGGEHTRVEQLTQQLDVELEALRRAAGPFINMPRTLPRLDEAGTAGELSPSDFNAFLEQLEHGDLAAMGSASALAPQLLNYLGEPKFCVLRDYMDSLDFTEAAQLLRSAAGDAIEKERAASCAKSIDSNVPQASRRVMLAEDSVDQQALIGALLREAGLNVTVVADGRDAVESALRDDFDLIVMDVQMPAMDGVDATRMLRACGYGGPIVALTANTAAADVQRCLEAGYNDVLAKPIDREHFLAVVAGHLGAHQATTSLFDEVAYLRAVEDHAMAFRAGLPAQIDSIRAALAAEDWSTLTSLVHMLRGNAGSFGFGTLTEAAGVIETELRASRTLRAEELCNALFEEAEHSLRLVAKEV